jgi:hypothetical protein
MKGSGILFHAKHALMPNSLGYCGPDDRGTIRQHLEESKEGERLVSTLQGFEAAYPFLKLIARQTGREVFDYSVPEAYWIGNGLLEKVGVSEFYSFSHRELKGRDAKEVKRMFSDLDSAPRPHHTFYVMATYAGSSVADGPNLTNERSVRISRLIDSCRISWGQVKKVGKRELVVSYRPVVLESEGLLLAEPKVKKVEYDPEIAPFQTVRPGDFVSLHWNYACEILTPRQLRNISKYTRLDLVAANRIITNRSGRSLD